MKSDIVCYRLQIILVGPFSMGIPTEITKLLRIVSVSHKFSVCLGPNRHRSERQALLVELLKNHAGGLEESRIQRIRLADLGKLDPGVKPL